MTLREALLTGLPLRRIGRDSWARPGQLGTIYNTAGPDEFFDPDYFVDVIRPDREDLLADDYEVYHVDPQLLQRHPT